MVTNTKYRNFNLFAKAGDNSAMEWIEAFWHVEEMLFCNISSILQANRVGEW
jgi:hypothetical protein